MSKCLYEWDLLSLRTPIHVAVAIFFSLVFKCAVKGHCILLTVPSYVRPLSAGQPGLICQPQPQQLVLAPLPSTATSGTRGGGFK